MNSVHLVIYGVYMRFIERDTLHKASECTMFIWEFIPHSVWHTHCPTMNVSSDFVTVSFVNN